MANHGYVVCIAAVLYDPAIFLTNDKHKARTSKTVDIQSLRNHVHFIARCSSSEAEHISYFETRLSCIQNLTKKVKSEKGNGILDICRCFKGDSPSRQFESGHKKVVTISITVAAMHHELMNWAMLWIVPSCLYKIE